MPSTINRQPYNQRRLTSLPLNGHEASLPIDAFVIEGLAGDSQTTGFNSGTTLEDGSTVEAGGGLIWDKWSPGASVDRINATNIGTDFVPITTDLGNSALDIGPEVSLGAARAARFRPGRYGLVKCCVPGADVGLPAAGVNSSLSPILPGALFEGFIEGHLKPAVNWCYENNLHPYLGAIYISLGGQDAIGAQERAMSFAANMISFVRGFSTRMGLLAMPKVVLLQMPNDVPDATFPNKAKLREQYPYLQDRPPFKLVDYTRLPRQSDAIHLTAQGQYDLGLTLADAATSGYGTLTHVDPQ